MEACLGELSWVVRPYTALGTPPFLSSSSGGRYRAGSCGFLLLRLRVGDSSCAAVVQEAGSSEAGTENVRENGNGWLFHCNDERWCNRMLLNIVTTDGIITLGRVTKIDNGACALGWVWPETRAKFAPKTVVLCVLFV